MKNILIKKIILLTLIFIPLSLQSQEKEKCEGGDLDCIKVSDGCIYGSELGAASELINLADLIADAQKYDQKAIQLNGSILDVCQSAGCWMVISDGTNEVRVITKHKFLLPKDCASKNAQVEGIFKIKEITEEQARHYNDESKITKIKSEDIIGPQKVFIIEASGVKILD